MSSLSLASYLRVSSTCARVSPFMVLFLCAHTPFVWWSNVIRYFSVLHYVPITVCLLDIVIRPCCRCFLFPLMRPQFFVAASPSWSGAFRLCCFLSCYPLLEAVMSMDPFNCVGGIWLPEVFALFGGCCMRRGNFAILTTNLNYFTSPIWRTK